MIRQIVPSLIVVVLAVGAGLLTLLDSGSPLRTMFAFGFVLIGPGLALVQLLHVGNWLIEGTLAIALSIALATITSEAMLYLDLWSPKWGLLILIGMSLVGITLGIVQTLGQERTGT